MPAGGQSTKPNYNRPAPPPTARPAAVDDGRPTDPMGVCIAGVFGTVLLGLIAAAIAGGSFSGTHRRVVLNLGEERLFLIDSATPLLITDDCRGCATVKAWAESPDGVPGQWQMPQTWARTWQLPARIQNEHYRFWYFHMRNGSKLDARAQFSVRAAHQRHAAVTPAGRLMTVMLEDRELGEAAVQRAAEDLWNTRFNMPSYPDTIATVNVDYRYPRAVVVVVVANDCGEDVQATIDLTAYYVAPDREASPRTKSFADMWSTALATDASRFQNKDKSNVPPGYTHVTVEAPRSQGSRSTDVVNIVIESVSTAAPSATSSGGDSIVNQIILTVVLVAVIAQVKRYWRRRPQFQREFAAWQEQRAAAQSSAAAAGGSSSWAGQPPPPDVEPIGGTMPTGNPYGAPRPL